MASAVIFDLDGTLVDTVEDLAAALNQALVELGLSPHPLDAVRSMVDGGFKQAAGSRARGPRHRP
jgi:phosphoglycolate phosphatase